MFGSGIFIFLSMIHVHNPLPVAILGGASWAYYGLKNKENAQ